MVKISKMWVGDGVVDVFDGCAAVVEGVWASSGQETL